MEKAPAELMKEYVNSQKFTSTTEIMEAMKAMSGDVLQQVMEAELDTKLGYHTKTTNSGNYTLVSNSEFSSAESLSNGWNPWGLVYPS